MCVNCDSVSHHFVMNKFNVVKLSIDHINLYLISYKTLSFHFLFNSQASSSIIYFTDILWPEFTIWHLIAGVFYYQRHHRTKCNVKSSLAKYSIYSKSIIEKVSNEIDCNHKQLFNEISTEFQSNKRVKDFLRNLESRKFKELVKLSAIELE